MASGLQQPEQTKGIERTERANAHTGKERVEFLIVWHSCVELSWFESNIEPQPRGGEIGVAAIGNYEERGRGFIQKKGRKRKSTRSWLGLLFAIKFALILRWSQPHCHRFDAAILSVDIGRGSLVGSNGKLGFDFSFPIQEAETARQK
jgi:hypothetical protein